MFITSVSFLSPFFFSFLEPVIEDFIEDQIDSSSSLAGGSSGLPIRRVLIVKNNLRDFREKKSKNFQLIHIRNFKILNFGPKRVANESCDVSMSDFFRFFG